MSLHNKAHRIARHVTQPRIFAPTVTQIRTDGSVRCPRCNCPSGMLYDLGEAGRGYYCAQCLIVLVDQIKLVTGIHEASNGNNQ